MNPADIVIRHACIDDAESLAAYMTDLIAENLDMISRRIPPTAEEERAWIEKSGDPSLILLAFDGPEVVGLLDIKVSEKEHLKHCGLLGMSIAKKWRRRGLGRRLLQAAIDRAKGRPSICRIELECVVWNPGAKRLYEDLGFVVEARKVKSTNLRGKPEDMYLMALTW